MAPSAIVRGALAMTFARLVFSYLAHAATALVLALAGSASPWSDAAPWWTVYGTAVDLACLACLVPLIAREGRTLGELVGFDRSRVGRDAALALGCVVLLAIVGGIGGVGTSVLVYGTPDHAPPMGGLPTWGTIYSIACWPLLWGFTEELTYNGYALPRLRAHFGRAWPAVLIVSLGWAVQHVALPAIFDVRFMAYRFLSALPIALTATTIYVRTGRLVPLIVAHVIADVLAPASVVLAPPHAD